MTGKGFFVLTAALLVVVVTAGKHQIQVRHPPIEPRRPSSNGAKNIFTCSIRKPTTVRLGKTGPATILSLNGVSSACSTSVKAATNFEKVSVKCSSVSLVGDYSLKVSDGGQTTSYTGVFDYVSNSKTVTLVLSSDGGLQSGSSYSCSVESVTSAPPVTSPPSEGSSCVCGLTGDLAEGNRIVGGEEAVRGDHPYIVALNSYSGTFTFCGGSLVSRNHVVTAAHCVERFNTRRQNVRLGQYNYGASSTGSIERRVRSVQIHPQYNSNTLDNDVAILTIDTVEFSEFIQPVCLPTAGTTDDFDGETVTISGWGTTSSGGTQPDTLREANVTVISNSECNDKYDEGDVTDAMLCAGNPEGGVDSCQGDSGGPLVHRASASDPVDLLGVVSWGIGCANAAYPGVYARVTALREWIVGEIGESSLCERPTAK